MSGAIRLVPFLALICLSVLLGEQVGPSQVAAGDDAEEKSPLPARAPDKSMTTYGTVSNVLAYESEGDSFYFRLEKMPKGIDWFKAKSSRSFAIVQQAADRAWTLRVWHSEKGETYFVKSIVSKSSSEEKKDTAGAAIKKQLEAMQKVRELVEKGVKPVAPIERGPSGKLAGLISNVCGKEFTVGEVADNGISIGVGGSLGTIGSTDVTVYQYILYALVTDPNGKKVVEGSVVRSYKNGDPQPEIGFVMRHQACPDRGKHKLQVYLFAIIPAAGQYSLLDTNTTPCEYTIK